MDIKPLNRADVPAMAAAFAALGWREKDASLYQRYLDEQDRGHRLVLVAAEAGTFLGYVCVVWESPYPPFHEAGIPEIADFNVLPTHRRRGVGTALMDAAEAAVATRSAIAGLGCGLTADYGPARALYLTRGYRPDGQGTTQHGRAVVPGDLIRIDDTCLMFTKTLGSPKPDIRGRAE